MAVIRNISGIDLIVPWLGDRLVLAGQKVEVPDADVYAYTQQTGTWEPADDDAKQATSQAAREQQAADAGGNVPAPAGNASRDEWAAWVTGQGLASADELDGLGRDAIREQYSTPPAEQRAEPIADLPPEPAPEPVTTDATDTDNTEES